MFLMCLSIEKCRRSLSLPYLDDVGKVFPLDVVVSLDEDLPQDGLSDGVVFSIELVEAVERVSVLRGEITLKTMHWDCGPC